MALYLIQAGEGGPVKIGFLLDRCFIPRLYAIQTNNHIRLTLLRALEGGKTEETALHKRFAHLRLHGEWFSFHPDMLNDLGLPEWSVPGIDMKPWPILRGWTAESRERRAEKQRLAWADPVIRERIITEIRKSKLRKIQQPARAA